MVVGIVLNEKKEEASYYGAKLGHEFSVRGIEVLFAGKKEANAALYDRSDLIISVGGDGTFLRTASCALKKDTPVFGFNLGTLGFLTEFEKDSIAGTVERIATGQYLVEERSILRVSIVRNGEKKFFGYAINDAVVTRDADANVCYLSVDINGVFVDTYPCDGIIVATQTGSTAYSLSAGGPIIEPGNDIMLITPICSHRMGSRSIVARPESRISVTPTVKAERMRVILDGHQTDRVREGDSVICESAEKKVKIVRIDPPNFYTAVSEKLFGGSVPGGKDHA